jgi:hypothetical protein
VALGMTSLRQGRSVCSCVRSVVAGLQNVATMVRVSALCMGESVKTLGHPHQLRYCYTATAIHPNVQLTLKAWVMLRQQYNRTTRSAPFWGSEDFRVAVQCILAVRQRNELQHEARR